MRRIKIIAIKSSLFFIAVSLGALAVFLFQSVELGVRAAEKLPQTPPTFTVHSFVEASGVGIDPEAGSFLHTRDALVKEGKRFVEVNLRTMKLYLREGASILKEVDVRSKGREGSWWETITGKYGVIVKEANHFSSIGKVWMPYSLQIYGNFFIHGWPYYQDGTPVSKAYSGGCIRLNTEDAKAVFEFVERGTSVIILDEAETIVPTTTPQILQNIPVPAITARAAFVKDVDSGFIYLNKSGDDTFPIASLTKLMTGVVASEIIYLERTIWYGGALEQAFDVLYPMLMQSSNEAADAIASLHGYSFFVSSMNDKAKALDLRTMRFADASGKSAGNVASARDLVGLAKYILEKRNFLWSITRGKAFSNFGEPKFSGIKNYNEFADDPRLLGVKNGKTNAAGETILTVWSLAHVGEEAIPHRIAVVVLGSEHREDDIAAILVWLKGAYGLQ